MLASKFVILRPPKLRTEILASLETDPVMMGEQELKVIKVRKVP